MKYFTYILFSGKLDRFYIGSTVLEVDQRLERHLSDYYGTSKFTHKVRDWEVFFTLECKSLAQARKIELHIKRMKSKEFIRNLKKFPAISDRLLSAYK